MKELITIHNATFDNETVQAVNARDLHEHLGVKEQFTEWAKRYTKKFVKNQDFIGATIALPSGQTKKDYAFSLDMAKHVAMMSETERSYEIRQYFIDVEKEYRKGKTPAEILLETAQRLVEHERRIIEAEKVAAEANELAYKTYHLAENTEKRLDQIETGIDHFTIIGYARIFLKKSLPLNEAAYYGKMATNLCNNMGILMNTVPDPRFGQVNTYPKSVLDEILY